MTITADQIRKYAKKLPVTEKEMLLAAAEEIERKNLELIKIKQTLSNLINPQQRKNEEYYKAKGKITTQRIAEELGIHKRTLENWVEKSMSPEKLQQVLAAINNVKNQDNLKVVN